MAYGKPLVDDSINGVPETTRDVIIGARSNLASAIAALREKQPGLVPDNYGLLASRKVERIGFDGENFLYNPHWAYWVKTDVLVGELERVLAQNSDS